MPSIPLSFSVPQPSSLFSLMFSSFTCIENKDSNARRFSARNLGLLHGRDRLGPVALEDLFRALALPGVLGMHGDEEVPLLELRLVLLGFVLGKAEPHESTGDTADGRADPGASERRE